MASKKGATAGVNYAQDKSLAGQSVKQGGYTVTYNDQGYVSKAVKDGGASATSSKKTDKANNSATHKAAYDAAKAGDWDTAASYTNQIYENKTYGDGSTAKDLSSGQNYLKELQDEFGYNGEQYYTDKYNKTHGITESGSGGNDAVSQAVKDAVNQAMTGGSKVPTGNGSQVQSGAPSVSYPTPSYPTLDQYMENSGYNDMMDQVREAIKASVNQTVNGLNTQIGTVHDQSDELARQAYIANMLGQKNIGQQLAASGYAGGMADSQRIAMENNYQSELNAIERQRADTVRELETAITNAQLTGDMETANQLSALLQNVQSQWNNYVQNQQAMANQNYWNQVNLNNQNYWNQQELENQNFWNQQELERQDAATAYSKALGLISQGYMPDDETLAAAGIDRTTAQQQVDLVLRELGLGGTTATPAAVAQNPIVRYDNAGLSDPAIIAMQNALKVTPDGKWGPESQAAALAAGLSTNAYDAYQQLLKAQGIDLGEKDTDNFRNVSSGNVVQIKRANGAAVWEDWNTVAEKVAFGKYRVEKYPDGTYEVKFANE